MRKQVMKPQRVDKGSLVIVSMRLPRSQSDARLSLWSATDGCELSPHIQYSLLDVLVQGKPTMHSAMYARLTVHKRKVDWKFIADDDLTFVVIQDVDTKDEPLAHARIRAYGTTRQAVRRFVFNGIRLLRRGAKACFVYATGRHSSI